VQSLAPTNPHWARVAGYGLFSLCVNHKEGLCPSCGGINRLVMMKLVLRMNLFIDWPYFDNIHVYFTLNVKCNDGSSIDVKNHSRANRCGTFRALKTGVAYTGFFGVFARIGSGEQGVISGGSCLYELKSAIRSHEFRVCQKVHLYAPTRVSQNEYTPWPKNVYEKIN
jgi:hypothetical protein